MSERMFRLLTADEVECRVSQVNQFGREECALLLYKDARCDMNILDETVGPMNWQREHVLIDGQLFCRVGIREEHENYATGFVWKEDVGTESYTEAEKGRASDAFKRACFNWGIGRELYTAPEIKVPCKTKDRNGKKVTYDRFEVAEIGYDESGRINHLIITKDKEKVFDMAHVDEAKNEKPTAAHLKAIRSLMKEKGVDEDAVVSRYGELKDWNMETFVNAKAALDKSSGAS